MNYIDADAIERVRKLKDKAKDSDKEHYVNFCYYHPEFYEKEKDVEAYLHDKYKQHRMCGEWFNLLEKLHHEKWRKMFPPKMCKTSE